MTRIDIIYNMTAVCPHDCAICCVDAAHVTREGDSVRILTEGLSHEDLVARPGTRSIFDTAAQHLQNMGLELSFSEKLQVINHIDVDRVRLDISGGDPLCVSENVKVLNYASEFLGRENISLTATGAGLAGLNISEIAGTIGEFNFTYDSAAIADVAHRPNQYANRNLVAARDFAAHGCVTRAEFPVSRSTNAPDHVRRLYEKLNESGVSKLLLMRLFPVGRGGQLAADIMNAEEYRRIISQLRALEQTYKTPKLTLQCALRHLEQSPLPIESSSARNPCDFVSESFGLCPDGTLLASPWAIDGRGRPLHEIFVLGNLAREPLSSILQTARVQEIRKRADENFGQCKIFSFIHSKRKAPIERLMDNSDPLYEERAVKAAAE